MRRFLASCIWYAAVAWLALSAVFGTVIFIIGGCYVPPWY